MKAFILVGMIFSAFLIILGIASIKRAGDVLAYVAIIAGILVFLFVGFIFALSKIKEKRESEQK